MLTPIDISNMEFSKATFGYNKNEVEEFVETVAAEYERLYKENIEYKDKINIMNEAIKNYKGYSCTSWKEGMSYFTLN